MPCSTGSRPRGPTWRSRSGAEAGQPFLTRVGRTSALRRRAEVLMKLLLALVLAGCVEDVSAGKTDAVVNAPSSTPASVPARPCPRRQTRPRWDPRYCRSTSPSRTSTRSAPR
jgi:hypothetical protein